MQERTSKKKGARRPPFGWALSAAAAGCAATSGGAPSDGAIPAAAHALRERSTAAITRPIADERDAGGPSPASTAPGDRAADPRSGDAAPLANTTVLHIGSSSAGALGPELKRQLGEHGVRVVTVTKDGTHLAYWGGRFSSVPALLKQHAPDLVIIDAGGNDAVVKDPSDRVESIRRLVAIIGDTPCVWVAPSMWQPDTGVLAMIREHAAPCRYFDTNAIVPDLPRDPVDKIHPNMEGRRRWAEAIVAWLLRERDPAGPSPFSLRPAAARGP